MDHSEAVQQMAAERYLLDELSPELRDAFEEHMFDCPECAFDLRAEAAFLSEAKVQLPEVIASTPTRSSPAPTRKAAKKFNWFFWQQPPFARSLKPLKHVIGAEAIRKNIAYAV